MYLCKFGGDSPTGSEGRAQKRLILQFLKDGKIGDLENKVKVIKTVLTQCYNT